MHDKILKELQEAMKSVQELYSEKRIKLFV
jgi:hypothetical protein